MTNLKLDSNADHELSESGTSGTVYIAMPNNVSVEIYFETDSRQNINLLSVGDAYQTINDIDHDYSYTLQDDHKQPIKAVIDQYLADNPIGYDDVERDSMDSLGFTTSDFLYG